MDTIDFLEAREAVERICDIVPLTLVKKEFTIIFRALLGRPEKLSKQDINLYYTIYEVEMSARRREQIIKTTIALTNKERDYLLKCVSNEGMVISHGIYTNEYKSDILRNRLLSWHYSYRNPTLEKIL